MKAEWHSVVNATTFLNYLRNAPQSDFARDRLKAWCDRTMRTIAFLVALSLCALSGPLSAQDNRDVTLVSDSVARILVAEFSASSGEVISYDLGSGFAVNENTVVTNHHVVETRPEITSELPDPDNPGQWRGAKRSPRCRLRSQRGFDRAQNCRRGYAPTLGAERPTGRCWASSVHTRLPESCR